MDPEATDVPLPPNAQPGWVLKDGMWQREPPKRESDELKVRADVAEYLQRWFELEPSE